jgi:PEP-CTERM motif
MAAPLNWPLLARATSASLLTFCALCLHHSTAHAALQSSDSFEYSPVGSDLLGKAGGTGWNGPWSAGGFNASFNNNYDIASGSLIYPGLASSGERVTSGAQNAISGITRNLAVPIPAALNQTTTRYLSVLLRLDSSLNVGAFNGFFGVYLDGGTVNQDDLFIGKPGGDAIGQWVVETRGGTGQVTTGKPVVTGETTLLVLKADLRAGIDTFSLVANPTLPGPEPAVYDAVKNDFDIGQLNGITIYSTGAFSVDEIRWGETYADVTPVPEPASISLMAAGALLLASAIRRRLRT